ncbi:hypothetical protein K402DRAFT_419555 [Aulographum hederae CBS 113979]|uniref:Uncharacterized protein n=1 Tax=Aulographum hederae CBS 113979 TaxID=1176131 RepID=A0A6G1H4Q5_9PEZI|nr:hypothetical protein K402DRAFT_419555 [Aulographum hederae CBS 113979]
MSVPPTPLSSSTSASGFFPASVSDPAASTIDASTTSAPTTTTTSSSTIPALATGLSQGAKTALSTTIPLVVVALLLGAFFLYRRKRAQKKRALAGLVEEGKGEAFEKPELDGTERKPAEIGGVGVHEMGPEVDVTPRVHELSSSTRPVELPG